MRAIVAQSLPGTRAEIAFHRCPSRYGPYNDGKGAQITVNATDVLPGMAPTPGNQRLATLADQASRDLGRGLVAAGDVSYVAQYLDYLNGQGAPGKVAHAPGETISAHHGLANG